MKKGFGSTKLIKFQQDPFVIIFLIHICSNYILINVVYAEILNENIQKSK